MVMTRTSKAGAGRVAGASRLGSVQSSFGVRSPPSIACTSRAPLLHLRIRLIARYALATVELIEAGLNFLAHFIEMNLTNTILVVQEPKSLANDLAGRLIQSAFDLLCHELFQFWRQRYIHKFFF